MKKITELKEGELLTLEAAAPYFKQPHESIEQTKKRLRQWRHLARHNPERFPKSAKIGGTVYYLRSNILDFLNREFSKIAS